MTTVFDTVSPHFSGFEEHYFNETFQPSANKIEKQMGDLFGQNRFYGAPTLSHQQLSCWLGQYAMYSIPNTSFRSWADSDSYNDDLPWKLAVWRLLHILPLGHAFSDTSFRINDLLSWNPLQQPATKGMEIKGSNRPLYANSISQGLFHKLFPEYFEEASSNFLNAILDVFAPTPNRDNPFYMAIRNAIRATVIKSPYPLPYFWHKFIVQFIAKSDQDIANYHLSINSPVDTNQFSIKPITESIASEVINYGDKQRTLDEQMMSNSSDDTPLLPQTDKVTETGAINESTYLRELISQTDFTEITSPDYEHVTLLLNEIGALVSQKIENGDFPINAPSAFAHKVDDRFFLRYPQGINMIHSLLDDGVSAETLDSYFQSLALIVLRDGLLTKPNAAVDDIKLAELHQQFVPIFFPEVETLPNNQNIRIKQKMTA